MLLIGTVAFDTYFKQHGLQAASVAFGVGAHIFLFRKGEWDLAARSMCKIYMASFVLTNLFVGFASGNDGLSAEHLAEICGLYALHFCGLALSVSVYRCFFHRLRHFPGPSLAGLSSWYMLRHSVMGRHQSEAIEGFHQKYGDFVRVGPNKLSIVDPAAIAAIYARGSTTYKGAFYNINHPRENLDMCRTKADHARRRKHWDRALSGDELRRYVPTITKHTERLLGQLQARLGQNVNAALWLDLFGFDVMFDVGFGQDMQRLIRGEEDFYVACAHMTLKLIGLFMHAPWMMHFFSWIPPFGARFRRFRAYSKNLVMNRLARGHEDRSDIFSHVTRTYEELPKKGMKDIDNLAGDADLLVLAGSDSIAVATSNVLYQLALHPEEQDKLRQELAGIGADGQKLQLQGNAHLDAVINESLRMNPTAPAGHERMTPSQGLQVGGTHVPGNVTVFVPNYTMCRDERFFQHPHEFIHERWTSRLDLNKDGSVFVPFQIGSYACPGRTLAFMEMRCVVSSIIARYTIRSATANMKAEYIDRRDDKWLLGVGELNLIFEDTKKPLGPLSVALG